MRNKRPGRKLVLKKETLAHLNDTELNTVKAGIATGLQTNCIATQCIKCPV